MQKKNAKKIEKMRNPQKKKKAKQMPKKSEKNDFRAGKITFFGLSRSAPDPGTCAWMTKRQENDKKGQTNDSGAGKMSIFGFSRSAPGLATRAGRENDKKMKK